MKALTSIAIAAVSMWIVGEANAQQQSKQTEGESTPSQFDGNKGGFGQRGQGQGKGRRGSRRGMQGQQGKGQRGMGQGQGQGQRGQGRRGGPQMMEFLFTRFDKNQDGMISQAEAPDRMKQRFGNLDTNGDQSVSKEELQAAFEKMGGGRGGKGNKESAGKGQGRGQGQGKGKGAGKGQGKGGQRGQRGMDPAMMIQKMDKNNDGVISLEEAPEKMKQRFDRLDADSSGTITAEEFKSAFDKMKKGKGGKDGKQIGRNKSADPEATKPVKPKRPPMAQDGA